MEVGTAGNPHGSWGDTPAGTYLLPHRIQPERSPWGAVPVPQQPVMILQQLPGSPAALATPHAREALIESMMIRNSQMLQGVMNSLAVSALTSFGFGASPAAAQATAVPLQTEEDEEAVVFHHHYIPYPGPAPVLLWPVPVQDRGPVVVRHLGTGSLAEDEEVAVPPPPPPSATGTVGADVLPAS
ncbi:PRR29 protein, partial [Geococcyx californianus]|nr:PRR29 protein [Geococcyx californianus]